MEAGFKGRQTLDYRFPTIKIYYADIAKVMEAYTGRQSFEMKLDASDWYPLGCPAIARAGSRERNPLRGFRQ